MPSHGYPARQEQSLISAATRHSLPQALQRVPTEVKGAACSGMQVHLQHARDTVAVLQRKSRDDKELG